ncbi:aminotransferase class III-fold pyridoxal phosphate-dependent enzyme [Candidatus Bathyarchaeota archaeon]|nr:MAG: aminotransferase class III-fold pyridoxal phosphate-dependent enzyme [Candidatus Bathyarchaeota archaeon]
MSGSLKLEESIKLYRRAVKVIPGASQTISKRPEAFAPGGFPIFLERGLGSHVWDVDGNEYIDYIMCLGPITLGYAYPAINEAIKRRLEDGTILSLPHRLEIEAAEAIIECVPCAEMVRFFKTGAEATAAAVRVARAYTGREKIVSYGYHGWLDVWAALVGGKMGRGVPEALRKLIIPFNYNDFESERSLENVLKRNRDEVACIVMNPIDYWSPPKNGYLKWVRELADEYNVILVFDEIVTGFRLALGGAQEYFDVTPDLACFAKGMSSGMPVSALAGKREMMSLMKELQISSTYGGEILSLAAVVAAIKEYKEKNVQSYLWAQGEKLMKRLNEAAKNLGVKVNWSGFPPISMFKFSYEDAELNSDLLTLFLQECASRGVLFRKGGPVYICYSHTDEDIEMTVRACTESLRVVKEAYEKRDVKNRLRSLEP